MSKKLGPASKPELKPVPKPEPKVGKLKDSIYIRTGGNAAAMQAEVEERLECPYDRTLLVKKGEYKNLPYYICPKCGWGTVKHEENINN